MKTFRIWLLILLAVLLPVRGAVAAAMMCPGSNAGSVEVGGAVLHESMAMEHDSLLHETASSGDAQAAAMDDMPAMASMDDMDPADHEHGGAASRCNLCCDFCFVTAMTGPSAQLVAHPRGAASSFPDTPAPAPTFLSDGQERPPRSS